jgi:hypothetical protein
LDPAFYDALSLRAKTFFAQVIDFRTGDMSLEDLLNHWSSSGRQFFADQSDEVQMEICAFVCAISHEWTHHFDLLGTPFGANLHAKYCREYLAFKEWSSELIQRKPEVFDSPLSDWLATEPAGRDVAIRLVESGPTGKAMADLRGPVGFDEVLGGKAFPRRIKIGWGANTGRSTIRLAGNRTYEKITVNQVWTSLRGEHISTYLGPYEILEGRAFVLNLLFIWRLAVGDDDGPTDILGLLLRYVNTYYSDAPRYLTALEIIAGTSVQELLATGDRRRVFLALTTTVIATWYALHSPPPVDEDDVLQSMTGRFIFLARVSADNPDWTRLKGEDIGLMTGTDDHFAKLGTKPSSRLLQQAAEVTSRTRELNSKYGSDDEIRNWFDAVLLALQTTLRYRIPDGYKSAWGLCYSGNSLDCLDDALDAGAGQLDNAPSRLQDWYSLRSLVLYKRGQRQDKIARLKAWFDLSI